MRQRLRLLYLIKDSPFEPRGHAAQRAHSLIREWSGPDGSADVTFFYPGKSNQPKSLDAAKGFEISGRRRLAEKITGVFQSYHFRLIGKKFADEVLKHCRDQSFDAVIAEELTMSEPGLKIASELKLPLFYIAHNFESDLYEQISRDRLHLISSLILKRKEGAILKMAAATFAFSPVDAEKMRAAFKIKNKIQTTRAGFDLKSVRFFEDRDEKNRILIVGALDYLPNVESVLWFASDIFPLITSKCFVTVAGRNPTAEVQRVCAEAGFELIASPRAMDPILQRGTIEVVSLKKGSGTRGKILEAMAAGLPIVSTRLGCEGLGLIDQKHLLVADNAKEFAGCIDKLLGDQSLRRQISLDAFAIVQTFSYRAVARDLVESIRTVL